MSPLGLADAIARWKRIEESAHHHRMSPQANIFSYRAARDTEVIASARRELATEYLSRMYGVQS